MYGASSSIVVSMLTPFARRVISRIRRLNRSKAFGAITRLTSGPAVKLNPRNFRSCGRATALFPSFTLSLSCCVMNRVMLSITRCPARSLKPSGMVGNALGIVGGVLLLLMYLYPLRKKWKWLSKKGKTKNWLDYHILMGLVGPVLI